MEDGGAQSLLAAEVVVKQRLIDARFPGDFLHAGSGGAAPEEHSARRIEDSLFGGGLARSRFGSGPFAFGLNHKV